MKSKEKGIKRLLKALFIHTTVLRRRKKPSTAATVSNAGLNAADENVQIAAIVIGVAAVFVSTILLSALLIRFRKKAEPYSGMKFE